MRRPTLVILLAVLLPWIAPPATLAQAAAPASVEIVRAPERLLIGQRVRLRARVLDDRGRVLDRWIAWRAESSSYVSLAADGRVTGIRPGRIRIMAVVDDLRAETTVEVLDEDVGSLELTPAYSVVRTGDRVPLRLRVTDGEGNPIGGLLAEWEVDPVGAVLDDEGTFVATEPGLYTILATVGDRKAVATVRVAPREERPPAQVGHGVGAAPAQRPPSSRA